jgi:murein DD-endopeptidase MepM/ murein hydrolase activator NlpD
MPEKSDRNKRHFRYRWIIVPLLLLLVLFDSYRVWVYKTPQEESVKAIYKLPYPAGKKYRCIKGRGVSLLGHRGPAYYSIDFGMPVHSLIVAARKGVVVNIKDNSNVGGWSSKYLPDANRVLINHGDGTLAQYLHLEYKGVLVKVGQKVEQGQPIGYSGNTGESMMPHLHFSVGFRVEGGSVSTIPIAFENMHGQPIIPRNFLSYTSNNAPPASNN